MIPPAPANRARRAHLAILAILQLVMAVQLVLLLMRGDWPQAFFVAGIMVLTLAPLLFRLPVDIPSEMQIVAILFVFATLYLGEVRDYYQRFWWWDMALHTTSGLLLGPVRFHVRLHAERGPPRRSPHAPGFIALFAFFFAVGVGGLWEIFEFAMDHYAGTDMQPATPGDPSGLTDTIHDLIVDTVGAAIVSLAGWRYLARARASRVDNWARRFIERNPQIFGD
jgi:hypothetical protein